MKEIIQKKKNTEGAWSDCTVVLLGALIGCRSCQSQRGFGRLSGQIMKQQSSFEENSSERFTYIHGSTDVFGFIFSYFPADIFVLRTSACFCGGEVGKQKV